ncbi:hypothetical protein Q4591_01945 [Shewanella sp. 3_MG-2023]|uniref:hypothetical protein n=1 Tax=Shewanella sp. 3_MG-2023 TaxID=3062635 RepID=UPI0026E12370|nr:hypothetical protein [Shewanella sp. 3_MG-2023]MDO6774102.1 hypothetical protein [Shewanella sp. 3_MG-2023]
MSNSSCSTDGTQIILANDYYECQFDVHLLATENDAAENVFKYDTSDVTPYVSNLADLVEVVVKDNEGNEANDVANVTVQLNED